MYTPVLMKKVNCIWQMKDATTTPRQKASWNRYVCCHISIHILLAVGKGAGKKNRNLARKDDNGVRIVVSQTQIESVVCCWYSSLLREVFLRVLRFSPLLKNQHFNQIPIRSKECPHTVKRIWSSRHGIMRYTNLFFNVRVSSTVRVDVLTT